MVYGVASRGLRMRCQRIAPLQRCPCTRARTLRTENGTASDREIVKAAKIYSEATRDGDMDADDAVATIMGAKDADSMTPVQEQYKDTIKERIAKKAAQMEAQEGAGREEFDFGVQLYERGQYQESEKMLTTALEVAGPLSRLGGDIQIQLALAMNANGKEQECIDVFKQLEEEHPLRQIQRQAENLRFIMEAPRLDIPEDAKVQMPDLNGLEANKGRRSKVRAPASTGTVPKFEKSLEEEYLENYSPPSYVQNKFFWAATAVVSAGMIYYSLLYRDCMPM